MESIVGHLIKGELSIAKELAKQEYPFEVKKIQTRSYSRSIMLDIFLRDGFIDRYSGQKLYHPGLLRTLHILMPEEFPFHAHGKANFCHDIFWDLLPSIDHLHSLHRGGEDSIDNYVTTSMKRNLAKNNWTIDDLGWKLVPAGDLKIWDGLSRKFIDLVDQYNIDNTYVKDWYRLTKNKIIN